MQRSSKRSRRVRTASIILREKSGASFVFVLGIMLLLMAIGASVLAASTANKGLEVNQTMHNRLTLLADSIQENILYSLTGVSGLASMSSWIVMEVFKADSSQPGGTPAGLGEIELEISHDGVPFEESGNIVVEKVTLSFPEQQVDYRNEKLPVPGMEREPATATVNFAMGVTVELNIGTKAAMTSIATYKYTGGELSDDPYDTGTAGAMRFTTGGLGEWELLRHVKLDL